MRHRKRALDYEMGSREPLTAIETPGQGAVDTEFSLSCLPDGNA
jgi:hypothetical protein